MLRGLLRSCCAGVAAVVLQLQLCHIPPALCPAVHALLLQINLGLFGLPHFKHHSSYRIILQGLLCSHI